jgi:hypothetical protein
MSDDTHACEYSLQTHKLLLEVGIELIGEAFPDYAMQFNEDMSVNTLAVDDLVGWRTLDVA